MVAALIVAPGCGGDDDGGSDTTPAATTTTETTTTGSAPASAGEAVDVSLTDFKIDPPNPRIARPGRSRFG